MHKHSLVSVDLDGTLTVGEWWGKGDPEPRKDIISLVNKMYLDGHHIIIFTARKEEWRSQTVEWLSRNSVWYHALNMGKMGADIYIDDKSIRPDEIQKLL